MPRLDANSYSFRPTEEKLFDMLLRGEVPAVIGDRNCMDYLVDKTRTENRFAVAYNHLASVSYTAYVQNTDDNLYADLEQTLAYLRASGEYDQILSKWIVDRALESAEIKVKYLIGLAVTIVLVSGGLFLTIQLTNRMLKKLVAEKTEELSQANAGLEQQMEQLASESRLRNLLIERSHVEMLLLDEHGVVLTANDSACELSHEGRDTIVGDRKSTRLNSSHIQNMRMPSSAGKTNSNNHRHT